MITAPMTYLAIELSASLLDPDEFSDVIALGDSGAGAGLAAALDFFAGALAVICCLGLAPSTQAIHLRPWGFCSPVLVYAVVLSISTVLQTEQVRTGAFLFKRDERHHPTRLLRCISMI